MGETTITAQGIVLALFFLFLGALLGDVLPDWRVKAVSIAVCSGLLVFLIEFFVGLTARLAAVLPHYEWVPPVLIGGVVLSLALPFLKPHSRFQMLNFEPLVPSFSAGQVVTGVAEFVNRGREDGRVVIDNYVRSDVDSLPPATSPEQQAAFENQIFAAFMAQSQIRNANPRHRIVPGDRLWMIAQGSHLSDRDAQGFQSGTKTLYFMGTIKHQDSRGIRYTDYCQYVVKDQTTHAIGVFPCRVHNGEQSDR